MAWIDPPQEPWTFGGGRLAYDESTGSLYMLGRLNGDYSWRIKKSDDEGETWALNTTKISDAAIATSVAQALNYQPFIAENGNLHALFVDNQAGDLWYYKSTDEGDTWETGINLTDQMGGSAQYHGFRGTVVAYSSGGTDYVHIVSGLPTVNATYDNVRDILYYRSTDGGASFSNAVVLWDQTVEGVRAHAPNMAYDGSGTLHVIYSRDNYGHPVYHRSTNHGATWEDAVEMTDGAYFVRPRIICDGDLVGISAETAIQADEPTSPYTIRNFVWNYSEDAGVTWEGWTQITNANDNLGHNLPTHRDKVIHFTCFGEDSSVEDAYAFYGQNWGRGIWTDPLSEKVFDESDLGETNGVVPHSNTLSATRFHAIGVPGDTLEAGKDVNYYGYNALVAPDVPATTGYASASVQAPTSDLTDFILLIDLSDMPASWWAEVDTSDGTKGRAAKDDETVLPCDWIAFDDVAETGWLRVLWTGTLASGGGDTLRIYPPTTANASLAAGDTYGQYDVYDSASSIIKAYWPDGAGTNRVDGVALTSTGVTPGDSTLKVDDATDYDGSSWSDAGDAFDPGLDDWGVIAWIEADSIANSPMIFSKIENAGASYPPAWFVEIVSNGRMDVYIQSTSSSVRSSSTTGLITTGTPYHLAGAWDRDGSEYGYLDGSEVTSDSITAYSATDVDNTLEFRLGARDKSGGELEFDGRIDEAWVLGFAPSAAWVEQEYDQTNTQATFWGTWTWTGSDAPDAPTTSVSSVTPGEIDTYPASAYSDPGSDPHAESRYRYREDSGSGFGSYTVVEGFTTRPTAGSPTTITGLTEGAQVEVQWADSDGTYWSDYGAAQSITVAAEGGAGTQVPTLTNPTGTQTGGSTADGTVDTDIGSGTLYWVATTSITKPSVTQIQAGQDNGGSGAPASANQAVSTSGTQNISATGLSNEVTYYFHYQHKSGGNDSFVVTSASFTTPDTTGPVLANAFGSAIGGFALSASVYTNEADGTLYWVCTTSATKPTEEQIQAGLNDGGTAAADSDSQVITSVGTKPVEADGLSPGVTYYVHFLHTDSDDNDSAILSTSGITTESVQAPTLSSPTATSTGTTTATASVTTDEDNGILYWVATESSTKPSEAQIRTGLDNTGSPATTSDNQSVVMAGVQNISITNLVDDTTYYIHFVQADADFNDSNIVSSSSITTDTLPAAVVKDKATTRLFTARRFTVP